MKNFISGVFIIYFSMIFSSALCVNDLPEEGMDSGYEPENVEVPDEKLIEDTVPVNEPEIEEKNTLENDESEEDKDYNAVENKIDEIKNDEQAITKDD